MNIMPEQWVLVMTDYWTGCRSVGVYFHFLSILQFLLSLHCVMQLFSFLLLSFNMQNLLHVSKICIGFCTHPLSLSLTSIIRKWQWIHFYLWIAVDTLLTLARNWEFEESKVASMFYQGQLCTFFVVTDGRCEIVACCVIKIYWK